MVYPMRRVFHVKVWLTEVSSDDEDEERIVICRTPSPRYSPDLNAIHHAQPPLPPLPNILRNDHVIGMSPKTDFNNFHKHNFKRGVASGSGNIDLIDHYHHRQKKRLNGVGNNHNYQHQPSRKYLEVNNNKVPSECDSASEGYETFDEMSSHLGYVSLDVLILI